MRALLLLGLALATPCGAQPAAPPLQMTGEALVKLMGNVDPATVTWSPASPFHTRAIAAEYIDMSNGEFVRGFIQGVHDATEGKAWCPAHMQARPLPHEMEADARNALQRMPAAQLKRGAAELIAEIWRASWPCPGSKRGAR
jgi:hypothetical protein